MEDEADPRLQNLCATVLADRLGVAKGDVPSHHVHAAMVGVELGLLLAQATGWDPPIPEAPEP